MLSRRGPSQHKQGKYPEVAQSLKNKPNLSDRQTKDHFKNMSRKQHDLKSGDYTETNV